MAAVPPLPQPYSLMYTRYSEATGVPDHPGAGHALVSPPAPPTRTTHPSESKETNMARRAMRFACLPLTQMHASKHAIPMNRCLAPLAWDPEWLALGRFTQMGPTDPFVSGADGGRIGFTRL